jgi:hypothetical protein
LNALNFPLSASDTTPDGITSDLMAWTATENTPWCNDYCSQFPTRDFRWGLAANTGAAHLWHIDSDGFGTFISPLTGGKLWMVARPVGSDPDAFSRTDVFSGHYAIEGTNEHIFVTEAMLLIPGIRL